MSRLTQNHPKAPANENLSPRRNGLANLFCGSRYVDFWLTKWYNMSRKSYHKDADRPE